VLPLCGSPFSFSVSMSHPVLFSTCFTIAFIPSASQYLSSCLSTPFPLCSAFLVDLHFVSMFLDGLLLYSQSPMYLSCLTRLLADLSKFPLHFSLLSACPQAFFAPQSPSADSVPPSKSAFALFTKIPLGLPILPHLISILL